MRLLGDGGDGLGLGLRGVMFSTMGQVFFFFLFFLFALVGRLAPGVNTASVWKFNGVIVSLPSWLVLS
jgi:hypothetical protein